jgi:hypothetical protein
MNIVFFNAPLGTNKISFLITEKTVDALKKEGIIPKTSATLIKKYKENPSDMDRAILTHIDKVLFDNYETPTKVEFDLDLIRMFFLDIYRSARMDAFATLDTLQLRAITSGNSDLAKEIEADKVILRNLPDVVSNKIEKLDCFFKINKVIPNELLVDYKEKYGSRFK